MESPQRTARVSGQTSSSPALRDPEGNLMGSTKLTRDMTERREKEETLTKAKDYWNSVREQRTAV